MILPQHTRASASSLYEPTELPDDKDWRGVHRVLDRFVSRRGVHEFVVRAGPRYEAEQVAALVGNRDLGEAVDATTDHALLVLLGQYARHLGLTEKLAAVPISQRTRDHTPQTKLIQLLVGVLAGQEYLQDFNESTKPLVKDQAVIAAWEQPAFAHYSGVSRTLEAADEQTLQAVIAALQSVSQPFIDAEVMALVRQGRPLRLDVDLTGRLVSPTSTTFPEADFGWMDDGVAKGYQAAITSLSGGPCQRLLLSSQRYPGRTGSAECLQAAVRKMEQVLDLHPRRRTERVHARLQALISAKIELVQAALERKRARQRELFDKLQAAREEEPAVRAEVTHLAVEYEARGWVERPHSKLAKARRRLASIQKRQQRAGRDLRANATRLTKLEHRLTDLLAQERALRDWLAELEADNATLHNPLTLVVRMDAGFSTDENLTWLIEMGYVVYTKAYPVSSTGRGNAQITARLRRQLPPVARWERVGRNAEAVHLVGQQIAQCPYLLETLLVRYHLPTGQRYTTLLYYGDKPPPTSLKVWFETYKARQTIEAGIKEGKGVCPMRRPWVRSPIGLQLLELFSLFAANFVRWTAHWARQIVRQSNRLLNEALTEVKTLVKIVANARARLVHNALGCVLIFDEHGPFAGSQFRLSGLMAYQQVLPLFKYSSFSPTRTTCDLVAQ